MPEQMLLVEVQKHDGMKVRCSRREFNISPCIADFSTLRLGHEHLGGGCIETEANVHN